MKRLLRALKTRVFLLGLVGGLTSAFGPVWAAVERGPAPDRAAFLASFGVSPKPKQQNRDVIAQPAAAAVTLLPPVSFETETENNEVRVARNRSLVEEDLRLSRQSARQIEAGEMTLAKPALQRFIEAHPLAHESRKVLVMLLIADRQLSEASEVLAEGMQLVPHRVAFKKLYARLQFGGDRAAAIAIMESLPPRLEEDPEYFELYGLLLQAEGHFEEANSIYRSLVAFNERHAAWWFGVGVSYDGLGLRREAEGAYAMAAQLSLQEMTLERYNRTRLKMLRSVL